MAAPNSSLQIYNAARARIASKFSDPRQQQLALQRFDSDPRVQQVRKLAGLAPVSTVQNDVKAVAKKSLSLGDTLADAVLSIPGSAANFVGNVGHSILHPIDTVANLSRVAGGEIQKIPGAKNVLQHIGADPAVLRRNQQMANAVNSAYADRYGGVENIKRTIATDPISVLADASTVLGGGAGAAGLVAKGAEATGAADLANTAASASRTLASAAGKVNPVVPVIKVTTAAAHGIRNVAGFEPVASILRRYVKTPIEDIKTKIDERARQNLSSSIYSVLPLRDRESLDDAISKMPANARENLSAVVRQDAHDLSAETTKRVQEIIQPHADTIKNGIAQDLARSRGETTPTPDDHAMASEAARNPTVMEDVGNTEASNIMAPYDNEPVVHNFNDLLPYAPGPGGTRVDINPEVSSMIRQASGRLALRNPGEPITVGEISGRGGIIPTLRKISFAGGKDAVTAKNAVDHLEGVIGDNVPGAGDAVTQMRDAYAARRRMAEGVAEGQRGRTETGVDKPTRETRNAYGTPEGTQGRTLGQASELEQSLSGTPDQNLRVLNNIAGSPRTQAGISGNINPGAGEDIAQVADLQTDAARRLGRLTTERGGDPSLEPVNIFKNLMNFTLHTNPGLKTFALARLLKGSMRIPEAQANGLTNMLFSRNPTQISKALNFLDKSGDAGTQAMTDIGRSLATGVAQVNDASTSPGPVTDSPDLPSIPNVDDSAAAPAPANDPYAGLGVSEPPSATTDTSSVADPYAGLGVSAPPTSPYAAKLTETLQNENPAFVNLLNRQWQQESHGDQSQVSKRGATGVAQVMPKTGPEAARLAGVPWDPTAWKNDAAYSKLLGHAYQASLLEKYGGDVPKALAAYNDGPGKVDKALATHGDQFLNVLPPETQDYVVRVGGQ